MTRSLLGRRLIAATRLAKWESQVGSAINRALAHHEELAAKALRASVHPDPFALDLWDSTVEEEVAPVIADVLADVAAGTLRFLKLPEATKALVLGRIDVDYEAVSFTARIQGMGATIADELRRSLNQGSSLGEPIRGVRPDGEFYGLQQRVQDVFGVGERRGETIARTEVHGAASRTGNETAAALHAEVPLLKTWVAYLDDRTRDAHAEADGQQVGFDEPFEVDGEELDYPGDPAGSAENVINCRCAVVYDEVGAAEGDVPAVEEVA